MSDLIQDMVDFGVPNYYVYLHKKASDGTPFYVGKGSGRRAHKRNNRSTLWKNVVEKHGFYAEIVKADLSEEEAFKLECDLITQFGRRDTGSGGLVNHTDGGDGVRGAVMTDELRAVHKANTNRLKRATKYKAAHAAGVVASWENPERRAKHSANMVARYADPAYKVSVIAKLKLAHGTPEAKAARSEMSKKYQSDPAVRAATAARMKVRRADPEYNAKVVAGVAVSWKSPERKAAHVARMQAAHADPASAHHALYKKVVCIETGTVYPSTKAAARSISNKASSSAVSAVCHGRRKSAYGFSWAFEEQKGTV